MKPRSLLFLRAACAALLILCLGPAAADEPPGPPESKHARREPARRTEVAIRGDRFLINGQPTYEGRTWKGHKIEGLLLQQPDGAGHLRRPEPRDARPLGLSRHGQLGRRAQHPRVPRRHAASGASTACWPSRSTCRAAARRATPRTSPGTTPPSPPTASCGPSTWTGWRRILDRADELGMVVILGLFYFGQDERLKDEAAVKRGRRQRGRLGARARLPQRPDRGQQRVQRPLRPRDPAAGPRPRADRARRRRAGGTAGGCWSAPATAAARSRGRTSSGPPTSCCCTATASSEPDRIAEMVRADAAGARLPADADPVQRGRPLRLRQAGEQLRGGGRASTPPGATSTSA